MGLFGGGATPPTPPPPPPAANPPTAAGASVAATGAAARARSAGADGQGFAGTDLSPGGSAAGTPVPTANKALLGQ